MKVIVCPDSFKGTLTAVEAARAIDAGVRLSHPDAETVLLPLGDGGEGTAAAIAAALGATTTVSCRTVDPLGREINASYFITADGTALIESAAAGGLTLLSPEERDIMRADTRGTGRLIADARRRGVSRFIICMGGTATCDGGYGAYSVIKECDMAHTSLTLYCDVDNPFCGPDGAAAVFAPQKGAAPEEIPLLEERLKALARQYSEIQGIDISRRPYAGAAGGLAGMLMACFGAGAVRGSEEVLRLLRFDDLAAGSDLIITGEGKADATTLSGKVACGVLDRARAAGIPAVLIAGRVECRDRLLRAGFADVVEATPRLKDPAVTYAEYLQRAAAGLI